MEIDGSLTVVHGAFSNQGQVCISLQRVFVHEEKYEEFIVKFAEATKQLKLGNPLRSENICFIFNF